MLAQPVPVTGDAPGAPLSRSDQVRQAARTWNTQRAYLGHWTRFHSWAQEQGLDLPEGLEAALCDYLVRLAEDGKRMATIRQARAAIIRGADLAGWPKPGGSGVAEMMRGLGRILRSPRDRRRPYTPRPWRRSGPPPSPAAAPGAVIPRRRNTPGAAAWSTSPWPPSCATAAAGLRGRRPALGGRGAGRRRQRPHPDSGVEDRSGGRGGGVVPGTGCRRSPAGHPPGRGGDRRGHSGLQPPPRHHPAASAAGSAGGWAPRLAGHHRTRGAGWDGPGPVGCGLRPPRADDGGTVEVSQDAGPVHRTPGSRTGAVARYYQGGRG